MFLLLLMLLPLLFLYMIGATEDDSQYQRPVVGAVTPLRPPRTTEEAKATAAATEPKKTCEM